MWDCEWKKLRAQLVKNGNSISVGLAAVPRLDVRSHLYGGRCEIFQMVVEVKDGERGIMLDVNSLYPSTMLFGRFLFGHPVVITHDIDLQNFSKYFGVALVTILPPTNLYVPIIPHRLAKGGTVYTLCRTCSETVNISKPCKHSDVERAITGVWITPLINRAVELGYRLLHGYEVHDYPRSVVYNPETNEEGLFSKGIRELLLKKLQSSGFPVHITTDEQKRQYCQEHERRMGVVLRPEDIVHNAGMRAAAKAACNCTWGSECLAWSVLNFYSTC